MSFAGLGYGDQYHRAGRSRAARRNTPRCKGGCTGWSSKEVRVRGDWTVNNPHPEASGWAFEYNNVYYPDTDDTAMVLMALRLVQPEDQQAADEVFSIARSPGS